MALSRLPSIPPTGTPSLDRAAVEAALAGMATLTCGHYLLDRAVTVPADAAPVVFRSSPASH
jgi:hypothetical protein